MYFKILQAIVMVSAVLLLPIAPPARSQPIAQLPLNRPTLQIGTQGDNVAQVQAVLKLMGYYAGPVDGVYRQSTAIAVFAFQEDAGINPDGIVGSNTWNALLPTTTAETYRSPFSSRLPILRRSMNTDAVVQLQNLLRTLGFFQGESTGFFGSRTEAAVKSLQRTYNLPPDGIVGPATWRVLLR
ncbi:peptidoglycan-binding domain-containing protein [Phormidium sp. CCY1219]|uniref:peptidoglycan-binding domain-containing protein n=1 Tax=Phormidium sp. CCY1219 TaxID=2886104 RepID=UPI002D1F4179|nr:peptidoglycan-binding protein [Phormidium sp. CCY1219]MEB3826862.1 peptidoglycan-binding protein [Phormidium sp. CCY1219]